MFIMANGILAVLTIVVGILGVLAIVLTSTIRTRELVDVMKLELACMGLLAVSLLVAPHILVLRAIIIVVAVMAIVVGILPMASQETIKATVAVMMFLEAAWVMLAINVATMFVGDGIIVVDTAVVVCAVLIAAGMAATFTCGVWGCRNCRRNIV